MGKPVATYFPPSAANVNCENPHGKPVLHRGGSELPVDGRFHPQEAAPKSAHAAGFFLNPPQKLRPLHRMYTARPALGLARTSLDEAQSNLEIPIQEVQ